MADATVLIYHMSEERMRMLKELCVSMGIRAAAVDRGMERAPVGLLSGLVNPVKLTQGASGRMKEIRGPQEIDEEMIRHFQPQIDGAKAYVDRKIGTFGASIYTRDSFFGNSAFTDLIHNLQLQITGADISIAAPLSFNAVIKEGEVTVADMFKLYRFENLLLVLRMTGEEIRKHLEMSYDMWTNQMKSPDDHILLLNEQTKEDQQRTGFKYYTFNFDSA